MDRKIDHIDLVLENCEVITVYHDNIERIFTGKVYKMLHSQQDDIWDSQWTNFLNLKLKKSANTFVFTNEGKAGERTALDRLKARDITHIDIHYTEGANDYISVPWKGMSDFHNKCENWKKNDDFYEIEWDQNGPLKKLFNKIDALRYDVYYLFTRIIRLYYIKKELNKCQRKLLKKK
jgi:hypothetical protein